MLNKCPKCKDGILKRNEEWSKEFGRLDSNTPSHELIYIKLRKDNIPLHTCKSCEYQEFA